jgi:hypothetical protein
MPLIMKWAALARTSVLLSAWLLMSGSLAIVTAYPAYYPWMIIYAFLIGFALMLFFWPLEELGQILIVVQNYWVNGIVLFALGILPCFALPTLVGGLVLFIAGILSLAAGANGEQGKELAKLGEIWKKEGWWKIWVTWAKEQ